MPLSENEQRILDQIEKHLQETDPRLVRDARSPRWPAGRRNLRVGVFTTVAGLALMVAALRVHVVLAFLGFAVAFVGAMMVERTLSRGSGVRFPLSDRSGPGPDERPR